MGDLSELRRGLCKVARLVVKIGSRSLAQQDADMCAAIAEQLAEERRAGRSVVLVSSGAIALGVERLGLGKRPESMALLQAAAAAGQSRLMHRWEEAFAKHDVEVAQILLTHADLADRDRYLNARAAFDALLECRALPVVNENDAVAVEEIRFGDNDQLAAMVATLVGADLLVLLTDVDGVLDAAGERVALVADAQDAVKLAGPAVGGVGTGGMASKVDAAHRATRRGVPVVIARASGSNVIRRVLAGEDVGTLFLPPGARLASRKHWIAYTLKPVGSIVVDAGAAKALRGGRSSLLPAGVVGVRGDFEAGDAVQIVGPDGAEIARGLARYGMRDVARLAGARTQDIEDRIGHHGGDAIVHRDDMVEI